MIYTAIKALDRPIIIRIGNPNANATPLFFFSKGNRLANRQHHAWMLAQKPVLTRRSSTIVAVARLDSVEGLSGLIKSMSFQVDLKEDA